MHPEILRELTSQRGREMRARAEQATLARSVIRARRRGARPAEADTFAVPAIPDYVDGSFRTVPDLDEPASRPGRVPSQHHAA